MGLPRHARSALRTLKAQKRPTDPTTTSQQTPATPRANVGGPSAAMAIPLPHDAHCIYAQLLMQLRWQLADARRENSELTTCLRRLLQQIQALNAVLDAYNARSVGRAQRVIPAVPDPRSPEFHVEPTHIPRNP